MTKQIISGVRDDLFLALRYAKRNTKRGPGTGLTFGRHWIFKWQICTAWERIRAGLATADWTRPQTAKSLYNDPDWPQMNFGVRIAIGRCLRFFVKHAMLPLQVINPYSTGTKRYMPIDL